MKKMNVLLSLCLISLALPAHSAIIKHKVIPKTIESTQTISPNLNSEANQVKQFNQLQTNVSTPAIINYPKVADVLWIGTDIKHLSIAPRPNLTISNISIIPTILIDTTKQASQKINVSLLDDFINYASPMARHYPPVFANRTDRYNTIQRVKQLAEWLEPYAKDKNASYEILLRATKLNAMARNLDLGSDYAVKASDYVTRALKINDSAEANFLYGVMLAEGGGFDEGSKYLTKAEKMGFAEATQSLAQADLLNDKKQRAIERLYDFKTKYPNDPYIDEQIRLVNSGEFYIWNIPVKPVR